jgi:hypothetical protein
MSLVVDRLPVSEVTVTLPVSPIAGVLGSTPSSDQSSCSGAACVRGTAVRLAGRSEVTWRFRRRLTLKKPANSPTSIVRGGFSYA